jgi:hypothetical protein
MKRRETLDYQPQRLRVPFWWHFVYSPVTVRNWLKLAAVLIALAFVALFGWVAVVTAVFGV